MTHRKYGNVKLVFGETRDRASTYENQESVNMQQSRRERMRREEDAILEIQLLPPQRNRRQGYLVLSKGVNLAQKPKTKRKWKLRGSKLEALWRKAMIPLINHQEVVQIQEALVNP